MSLPSYDRNNRVQQFEILPKGAYVIAIKNARIDANKSGSGSHITIAFDIAEGEYKDIYMKRYKANTDENAKWPQDGMFYVTIPEDGSQDFIWKNYNSFFADLEDSNQGYVFNPNDISTIKGKLLGGKFHIEQNEYNGKIYDHTRLKWTCVADDVRNGKAGRLPQDSLISQSQSQNQGDPSDYMDLNSSISDDEIPFA